MITKLLFLALLAPGLLLVGCGDSASNDAPLEPTVNDTPSPAHADDHDPAAPSALEEVDADALEAIIAETAASDQVLVIDFWATWCVPCIAMFPDLHEGVKQLGDNARIISVTLDGDDAEDKAIQFLTQQHATDDAYQLVQNADAQIEVVDRLGDEWQSLVVPAILVFDREGNLAGEFLKGPQDVPAILARAKQLAN